MGEQRVSEDNAKIFWKQMEDSQVDLVFEHLQEILLSLKQKIKNGTATSEECCQALAFLNQVDTADLLSLTHVNHVTVEGEMQKYKPDLHPPASSETTGNTGDGFSLKMAIKEMMNLRNNGESAEMSAVPSKFPYRNHICSKECLAKGPWNAYKNENPLHLPILYSFQRRHAKANLLSKSHDVFYKAPCGRSLRNFLDVQNYLFQTKCNFLFLDHFSFNTYVQVFRNSPSHQECVFDFDISKGVETRPISFCNDIDHDQLPSFKYRKTSWPRGYFLNNLSGMFLDSCSCTDGCTDRTKCACLRLTERNCNEASVSPGKEAPHGYSYKRLDGPISSGIYECNLSCSCDKMMCQNRLVQHGLQVRLQVFHTGKKGWGVRCLDDIDKGTFVCTYSGRLVSRDESRLTDDDDYEVENNSDRSCTLYSRKRKVDTTCSDFEFTQTNKDSTPGKGKSLPIKNEAQPSVIQSYSHNRSWNNQASMMPETRAPVLQSHQQPVISHASSEGKESSVCRKLARRVTTAAKKEPSLQREPKELVNTAPSEVDTNHHEKKTTLSSKSVQDDRWTRKQCKDNIRTGRQELDHSKKTEDVAEACQRNFNKENLCLLDASREGNVGRFLNLLSKSVRAECLCRDPQQKFPLGGILYKQACKSWN
ncbi:histone-lysine N-methyltransferase SETDB2 isoform X2 [Tiliqua scincoides]|uniref:histone-lysine N-methyltransferase SETDB2 isoform X2 n=1 Tax=Tiliqua scincoides TaxID=71010 RepID=UPI0034623FA8